MRVKIVVVLAVGCVSLPLVSAPALSQTATPRTHAQRIAAGEPMLGSPVLVHEARKYIGTNPTARKRLWCATFMNFILAKAGYTGTHSDATKSFAYYGRRIYEPKIGAIAVLSRGRRGGHVGVVSGIDAHGNPIIISGNHNRRVGEAVYPRSRVIAYVLPTQHHLRIIRLAARRSSVRAGAEGGIDSPITELLAAIEAEQIRRKRRVRPAVPTPSIPHRIVRQIPTRAPPLPEPHRLVQQMPERPVTRQQDLTMERALKFLGLKNREQRQSPQRQQRVERQPGQMAADAGLAGLFGQAR